MSCAQLFAVVSALLLSPENGANAMSLASRLPAKATAAAIANEEHHATAGPPALPSTSPGAPSSPDRRAILSSLAAAVAFLPTAAAFAASSSSSLGLDVGADAEGVAAVTRSSLGTSFRRATVRGAQLADNFDEKWERYSDSRRDKNRCDPVTNRRLFDNGFRKDGSRVGDPVLGGLCTPEPLLDFDDGVARLVLAAAEGAAADGSPGNSPDEIRKKVAAVNGLVAPSFARAAGTGDVDDVNIGKRLSYNRNIYSGMKAYGELLLGMPDAKAARLAAADFEMRWGTRVLFDAAAPLVPPARANRRSFASPFPALTEDDKIDLDYREDDLLDGLGTVSAALRALQAGGLVGHWEISIPTDDFGEVVTVAVDDDISLGAQTLLREGEGKGARGGIALNGSVVTAVVRAALKRFGVVCSVDAFFLDPSTTKQDVYNPTQLLLNLSNLKSVR